MANDGGRTPSASNKDSSLSHIKLNAIAYEVMLNREESLDGCGCEKYIVTSIVYIASL